MHHISDLCQRNLDKLTEWRFRIVLVQFRNTVDDGIQRGTITIVITSTRGQFYLTQLSCRTSSIKIDLADRWLSFRCEILTIPSQWYMRFMCDLNLRILKPSPNLSWCRFPRRVRQIWATILIASVSYIYRFFMNTDLDASLIHRFILFGMRLDKNFLFSAVPEG